MKQIISLFFILFLGTGYAQDVQTTEFFMQYSKRKVHYAKLMQSNEEIGKIKTIIQEKEITNRLNNTAADSNNTIILTVEEKEYLKNELDKLALPESYNFLDNIPKYKLVKNFDSKTTKPVEWFSKPIFIRNNTLCLIYKATYCGPLSGMGGWEFYRLVNEKWENWISLTMWFS